MSEMCIVREVVSDFIVNRALGTMSCTGAPNGTCTLTADGNCDTSRQKGLRLVAMKVPEGGNIAITTGQMLENRK